MIFWTSCQNSPKAENLSQSGFVIEKDTVDEREEDPITKIWHAVSSGLVAKQIAEEQRQGKFLKGQEG